MKSFSYKGMLPLLMVITLSLPLGVFAIDINVSARVPGCGDGVIESSLGEQCEGNNLGGQSCASVGYQSGILSCTTACTFDVSACSNVPLPSTGGSGSSTGGRVRVPDTTGLGLIIPNTNVVFSGTADPGSWVIVLNNGSYFASTKTSPLGTFIATVSDFVKGRYNFAFYELSSNTGLSLPKYFDIELQQSVTTKISNINFLTPIIFEQTDVLPIITPEDVVKKNENLNHNQEEFIMFIEELSDSENIQTPEELLILIDDYVKENNSDIDLNFNKEVYEKNIFPPFFHNKLSSFKKVAYWYPNVYVSFMTPYWIIAARMIYMYEHGE